MQVTDTHKFKNEASRRFHDYVKQYAEKSRENRLRVYELFGVAGTKNPSNFFSKLVRGDQSVTLDQIYIAKKEFGLNPGYLFEISEQDTLGFAGGSIVEEAVADYGFRETDLPKEIGYKLETILKKHKVKIEPYANQRLGISKQALYDKLKGKTRVYFDEVLMVCEDTAESLEQFRRTPLPKGHHLQQMEMMEQMIEMLKAENVQLKKELKKKK